MKIEIVIGIPEHRYGDLARSGIDQIESVLEIVLIHTGFVAFIAAVNECDYLDISARAVDRSLKRLRLVTDSHADDVIRRSVGTVGIIPYEYYISSFLRILEEDILDRIVHRSSADIRIDVERSAACRSVRVIDLGTVRRVHVKIEIVIGIPEHRYGDLSDTCIKRIQCRLKRALIDTAGSFIIEARDLVGRTGGVYRSGVDGHLTVDDYPDDEVGRSVRSVLIVIEIDPVVTGRRGCEVNIFDRIRHHVGRCVGIDVEVSALRLSVVVVDLR